MLFFNTKFRMFLFYNCSSQYLPSLCDERPQNTVTSRQYEHIDAVGHNNAYKTTLQNSTAYKLSIIPKQQNYSIHSVLVYQYLTNYHRRKANLFIT
jgi:hypothetical protein